MLYYFLQIINCHESVIYLLAPLRYATIYGCSDATIVLGAVGKVRHMVLVPTIIPVSFAYTLQNFSTIIISSYLVPKSESTKLIVSELKI